MGTECLGGGNEIGFLILLGIWYAAKYVVMIMNFSHLFRHTAWLEADGVDAHEEHLALGNHAPALVTGRCVRGLAT